MKTRIALVGVGGYGTFYLQELLGSNMDGVFQLVAGIDPYPDRSPMWVDLQQAGIPIYADLDTFFKHDTADLVILAAPIHLHAPLTCQALSRGCNVLCEKPLGGSVTDVHTMLDAEKRSGKLVSIGYQWSFSDAVLALKRDILAGRFGKPLQFKTMLLWPRSQSYYQRNHWAGRIRSEDGAWILDSPVNNATAHYLHNMLFLLGATLEESSHLTEIEAELYRANPIENYDSAALRVKTTSGINLLFYTTHSVIEQSGPIIRLEFEHAVVSYSDIDPEFRVQFRNGIQESYGNPDTTIYNKLWHTIEAVQTGLPVACGVKTALPHLICVVGAQQSPVMDFDPKAIKILEAGNDCTYWVEGLAETLTRCYQESCLPSEHQSTPWKANATRVSLNEYEKLFR